MKIEGVVSSNKSEAKNNIKIQKKFFKQLPYINKLYDGTINLTIAPKRFEVIKTMFQYENINWGPIVENFEFIPIRKMGRENSLRDVSGYLYLPSGSPNRQGAGVLEIWAEKIENINQRDVLIIEIPDGYLKIN